MIKRRDSASTGGAASKKKWYEYSRSVGTGDAIAAPRRPSAGRPPSFENEGCVRVARLRLVLLENLLRADKYSKRQHLLLGHTASGASQDRSAGAAENKRRALIAV